MNLVFICASILTPRCQLTRFCQIRCFTDQRRSLNPVFLKHHGLFWKIQWVYRNRCTCFLPALRTWPISPCDRITPQLTSALCNNLQVIKTIQGRLTCVLAERPLSEPAGASDIWEWLSRTDTLSSSHSPFEGRHRVLCDYDRAGGLGECSLTTDPPGGLRTTVTGQKSKPFRKHQWKELCTHRGTVVTWNKMNKWIWWIGVRCGVFTSLLNWNSLDMTHVTPSSILKIWGGILSAGINCIHFHKMNY